jgi:hypothetical protein
MVSGQWAVGELNERQTAARQLTKPLL